MGDAERILKDELRAAHQRERELLQTIRDLTDRLMFLSGKQYAPTELELAEEPEAEEDAPEDPDFPGYTADPEAVPI